MGKFIQILFVAVLATATTLIGAAHAESSYKIRSGDTLQVEVLEDSSLNRSVLVLPDGSISFPLAGGVDAAGMTTGQIASALASSLSSNFANSPNVHVSVAAVGERRSTGGSSTSIYITGEISNPGKITGSRGVTILQAIAQAGGLTRFAAAKRIQLRRGNTIYSYNYITNGGEGSIGGNTRLKPGDVIVVPQRKLFE